MDFTSIWRNDRVWLATSLPETAADRTTELPVKSGGRGRWRQRHTGQRGTCDARPGAHPIARAKGHPTTRSCTDKRTIHQITFRVAGSGAPPARRGGGAPTSPTATHACGLPHAHPTPKPISRHLFPTVSFPPSVFCGDTFSVHHTIETARTCPIFKVDKNRPPRQEMRNYD